MNAPGTITAAQFAGLARDHLQGELEAARAHRAPDPVLPTGGEVEATLDPALAKGILAFISAAEAPSSEGADDAVAQAAPAGRDGGPIRLPDELAAPLLAALQYRHARDPKEPLLRSKARALVHFAVEPDLVSMTTKLEGKDTFFLPINRRRGTGAGNLDSTGCWTAYLWEEVWARDNSLDILGRFVHIEKTEKGKDKAIVVPRHNQWDAVRKVLAHVRAHGAGVPRRVAQHQPVQHARGHLCKGSLESWDAQGRNPQESTEPRGSRSSSL